ncbi:MAG: hypothetical protein J6R17_01420 [Bacteroidales bacterium]|nr:hypothetical protein [Bacteroidales bacterium]
MKKIIFILLSLLIGSLFSSCNTTKRAEKRIYNIVENHQELIQKDTVKIDTVLTVPVLQDSAILDLDTIVENQTHTIRTERGEFGITILPSKEVKINYLPDSVDVHFRTEKIYDQIVIEQPKEKWRDVLFACIIAFVGLLFLKMFFERLMK